MISVIVPIYKVEPYLNQCIESIVNQTYKDLEIILVDDGSPDNCPAMCDAWAEKDHRIKVIHKANGGLSDARNVGIDVATGAYLGFVDSDDWIAPDFYEKLERAIRENEAQIAASGIEKVTGNLREFSGKLYADTIFTPEQAIGTILNGDGFHAVAWNKLYRRDLFEGIRYPKGKLHEDEFVTYRVMDRAGQLVLCQDVIYYYLQRQGSIMNTWSIRHLDALEARMERLQLLKDKYPALYINDRIGCCLACVNQYRMLLHIQADKSYLRQVSDYRKKVHIPFRQLWKRRLNLVAYVLFSSLNIHLFAWMLNLKNKV